MLLDVEDGRGHDSINVSGQRRVPYPACECPPSTSSRCTGCRRCTRRTRRCWTTSRWPSTRAPRSACSATTAPASRRCCGSWRAPTGVPRRGGARARGERRDARAGAAPRRDQGRQGQRRGRRRRDARRCSTASTSSRPTTPTRPPRSSRGCRPRSTPPTRGTSTRSSTTRWTRCACRRRDAEVGTLSGGERRRVALCRLLLSAPDLLLLDEPTNHLDAESVAWLERHLAEYKGTIVAVTHDRYFLDNVAGWILELDRGRGIPYEGNYSSWLEQKQARLAQEERSEKARERTIAAELEWVRTNPKGRRTKSKARLARYEELVAEERNVKLDEVQIHIPPGPAPGRAGADGERPRRKGFGERLLIESLSLRAAARRDRRRDRRQRRRQDDAVPDDHRRGGARRRHARARRHRQARLRRPVARRARPRQDACGRRSPAARTSSRSASARSTRASTRPASTSRAPTSRRASATLSGGERNRVHLAKLLRSGGNLLLLDEPTNDLDVDTLRALENALLAFPGLRDGDLPRPLVPGPRRHARAGVRGRLAGDAGSRATSRPTRSTAATLLGAAADRPHRITYKRLVRG